MTGDCDRGSCGVKKSNSTTTKPMGTDDTHLGGAMGGGKMQGGWKQKKRRLGLLKEKKEETGTMVTRGGVSGYCNPGLARKLAKSLS